MRALKKARILLEITGQIVKSSNSLATDRDVNLEILLMVLDLADDVNRLEEYNHHMRDEIVRLENSIKWLTGIIVTVCLSLLRIAVALLSRG